MKKITKYTLGVLLLAIILSITMLSIVLEPSIKIRGMMELDVEKLAVPSSHVVVLDNEDNPIADSLSTRYCFAPIESIGTKTRDAFVSVEDKRFYSHQGIDYIRVLGAAKNDILAGSFQEGASTITQQLVKNTHLSSDKTIERKIQEMRIARDVERRYNKEKILECYLNTLYFGFNLYGIGTAAKVMFGKDVQALHLDESALLAAIINNPAKYSPYANPENAIARRNLVLTRMRDTNKISQAEFEEAKSKELHVMSDITPKSGYFDAVFREAATVLNCNEKDISQKAYRIGVGYETDFQVHVDAAIEKAQLPKDVLSQVIILDNLSGSVLAASGDTSIRRQPGSTIKPIIAYAPAIEQRIAFPSSPILDQKTEFAGYCPSNYKEQYEGWTSVENALKKSSNVCAVKLLEMTGVEHAKAFARRTGLTFEDSDNSLALALGGMEKGLTLQTIAGAYQAFANDGNYTQASYIRYIKNANGDVIYCKKPTEKRVMSDITSYFINDMLQKCALDGTARKLGGAVPHLCAKTGTVGNELGNTDAYCIAYTPEYTVAVWIGSADNNNPHSMTGGGVPTEIARDIFKKIAPKNSKGFRRPKSIQEVDLDIQELSQNHRLIQADDKLFPRYRKTAEFPATNIPHKKITPAPYYGGADQTFTTIDASEQNKPFAFATDSPTPIDPNNYIIVP